MYLSFQSIDDIKRSNGLSLCVFSVSNGISDDTLEKDFKDTTGFFVDKTGDTLDTATTGETTDGGFRDTL